MTTSSSPGESALRWLGDLPTVLYEVLETAVASAHAFFEDRAEPANAALFPNLVRYFALTALRDERYSSQNFHLEELANNGIRLERDGCVVRVWKADSDGRLPAPGQSAARQEFYYQPMLPFLYEDREQPAKLAILWNTNGPALTLTLVCPAGTSEPWEPGLVHWEIEIPHPASKIRVPEPTTVEGDLDDLHVALRRKSGTDE
jgi:hypothetical protein